MSPRRKTSPEAGLAALREWLDDPGVPSTTQATAVRFCLEEVAARHPGKALEVRVPPWGVIQCIPGPGHTRGTPPAVVETSPETWLQVCVGTLTWSDAVEQGHITATGLRADLSEVLPLFPSRSHLDQTPSLETGPAPGTVSR